MIPALSATQRETLDQALSELAGRWDGAVDFWPLVCMEAVVGDPAGFVHSQIEKMRSAIQIARDQSFAAGRVADSLERDRLDWLTAACDTLELVFARLIHFRLADRTEVTSAIALFARVHELTMRAIRAHADAAGIAVSYFRDRSEGHDDYIRGILEKLPDQFAERMVERAAELAPVG